ncbi:MAG: D-2-hydroxyacid dehydrogenase [Planctomycetota bacterium]
MQIVVLDGHTLNPGDLSWDGLRALGSCTIHERSDDGEIVPRARSAEIVITNKAPLDAIALEQLPRLRYIGITATGYNIVDVAAARARGIVVTNVPSYGTDSVAQLTFAHILNLASRVGEHARSVSAGDWCRCPDFTYWNSTLTELSGLVLGIVGLGRIGRAVADLGVAFGMKVVAHSPSPPEGLSAGIEPTELDDVFRRADVVTLHCPLTQQTQQMVNHCRLALMKPTAWLINTSRGGLVDEEALAAALTEGRLGGAGLDVLSVEPPQADNPLLTAPNCHITPHLAWGTTAARQRLMDGAVANLQAFLNGKPQNVVS